MSFFTIVKEDGSREVIEAPSKSAANAWVRAHLKINIEASTKADLTGVDLNAVPSVEKGGRTAEEKAAEEAAEAQRKAEREAKKAEREAKAKAA